MPGAGRDDEKAALWAVSGERKNARAEKIQPRRARRHSRRFVRILNAEI